MTSSSSSTSADIVVIGAGIIGLACALRLQHDGLKVALVDRDEPGHGASFGNAGHIATEQIYPLASPQVVRGALSMLKDAEGALRLRPQYLLGIAPWLVRFLWASRPSAYKSGVAALTSLQSTAAADLQTLLAEANAAHLLHMDGHLVIIERESSLISAKREIEDLAKHGVHADWLDADQVREISPDIATPIQGAYHHQGTGHVEDPLAVCDALFAAFIKAGGQFSRYSVTHIAQHSDGFTASDSDGGKVSAKRILLAAGAWSAPLAAQLGYKVPLDTERGYHIALPQTKPAFNIPIASYERKVIMTPMSCGLRMTGTVEFGGLELPPDERRFGLLRKHIHALLPRADVDGATTWMGFRPSLPDHLPVIGKAPDGREIYFAFGHQHLGVTLAGVTSRLISNVVRGDASAETLKAFRISRF
ncbi:MAG: FAD-binding oxidoreductase [Rhodocyclaceae bacterium]|nr:FAD-binding oxidoreductase [Rhodocyclaceae bacterium]MCA3083236.1 FAD-binding oxidoreductase [Rhodocyclaceae bacterium]